MVEDKESYLSFQEASQLVAAIQEEENIHQQDRRILTVYNHDDRELCWFDFAELIQAVGPGPKEEQQAAVQNYILHHIPTWAKDR
jgi:hypothetical protein